MTRILAIDPGSTESAWLLLVDGRPAAFAKRPNEQLRTLLRDGLSASSSFPSDWSLEDDVLVADVLVIEQIRSFGMAVGAEVFDTVHWSGRFHEIATAASVDVVLLPRLAVKTTLCGSAKAKDANIRQALIDRFGGSAAIGTTKNRGPLYGISKDVWSALAIAVTFAETNA